MSEDDVMRFAQRCFDANMARCGFSFTPSGILKAAFQNGVLYENWETRMREHKPNIVEHPKLYRTIRLFDKKKVVAQ